jgi:hypothetical protein
LREMGGFWRRKATAETRRSRDNAELVLVRRAKKGRLERAEANGKRKTTTETERRRDGAGNEERVARNELEREGRETSGGERSLLDSGGIFGREAGPSETWARLLAQAGQPACCVCRAAPTIVA